MVAVAVMQNFDIFQMHQDQYFLKMVYVTNLTKKFDAKTYTVYFLSLPCLVSFVNDI